MYGTSHDSKKNILTIYFLSELIAVDWVLVNSPMFEISIILHPISCFLDRLGPAAKAAD